MRGKINACVNVLLIFAFLVCGLTGIIKMPELNVPLSDGAYEVSSLIHDWSGVALFLLLVAHSVLHAKWFARTASRLGIAMAGSSPKQTRGDRTARSKDGLPGDLGAVPGSDRSSKKTRISKVTASLLFLLVASSPIVWARGRHFSMETVPQGISYAPGSLVDGVYLGTANGYEPGLTVKVTVAGGSIRAVEVVQHNETMRWFLRVIGVIPSRIVDAGGTEVDAVSGATSSSFGIMSAVEDALKGAVR